VDGPQAVAIVLPAGQRPHPGRQGAAAPRVVDAGPLAGPRREAAQVVLHELPVRRPAVPPAPPAEDLAVDEAAVASAAAAQAAAGRARRGAHGQQGRLQRPEVPLGIQGRRLPVGLLRPGPFHDGPQVRLVERPAAPGQGLDGGRETVEEDPRGVRRQPAAQAPARRGLGLPQPFFEGRRLAAPKLLRLPEVPGAPAARAAAQGAGRGGAQHAPADRARPASRRQGQLEGVGAKAPRQAAGGAAAAGAADDAGPVSRGRGRSHGQARGGGVTVQAWSPSSSWRRSTGRDALDSRTFCSRASSNVIP